MVIEGKEFTISIDAKVYDFGIITIRFMLPISCVIDKLNELSTLLTETSGIWGQPSKFETIVLIVFFCFYHIINELSIITRLCVDFFTIITTAHDMIQAISALQSVRSCHKSTIYTLAVLSISFYFRGLTPFHSVCEFESIELQYSDYTDKKADYADDGNLLIGVISIDKFMSWDSEYSAEYLDLQTKYVYANGMLLARYDASPADTHYYHHDGLGSVIGMTNDAGNVEQSYFCDD